MQRLLKEVKIRREAAQATKGHASPPILYLDCRGISSPEQFANALRELVTMDAGLVESLEKIFEPAPDKEFPMESIFDSFDSIFEATRSKSKKPVFIIDEAHMLLRWRDDPEHKQLKSLLRFFVATTKQDHLGHVVLATSEYSFLDYIMTGKLKVSTSGWCLIQPSIYLALFFLHRYSPCSSFSFMFAEGLTSDQYISQRIGDLADSDEAQAFVESRMRCGNAPSSFFDTTEDGKQIDMWPLVYDVCGGNIGTLESCALSAKELGSWEKGISVVTQVAEDWVKEGFSSENLIPEDLMKEDLSPEELTAKCGRRSLWPAAWTTQDYKTVLREIAVAKYHAVPLKELITKVSSTSITSMLEWNFVAVRSKSEWAKDLPVAVFEELQGTRLVTMPTPACLYIVKKMHAAGKLNAEPKTTKSKRKMRNNRK